MTDGEPRTLDLVDRDLRWLEKLLQERKEAAALALKLQADTNDIRFQAIATDLERCDAWQNRATGGLILIGFMGFGGMISLVVTILQLAKGGP